MTKDDVTRFLMARISEEESAARSVDGDSGDVQRTYFDRLGVSTEDGRADLVWLTIDPARVLGECAAKRRVLFECSPAKLQDYDESASLLAEVILGHLAKPYSDHPDYRSEWHV